MMGEFINPQKIHHVISAVPRDVFFDGLANWKKCAGNSEELLAQTCFSLPETKIGTVWLEIDMADMDSLGMDIL